MKICILGKYPPIEGGVSANTYWLARGLAEQGHQIHVVTNADEVEEMYRLSFVEDDWPWYQPEFAQSGGYVRVYNVESFSQRTMGHIPLANPFVSKLASLATDIVRRNDCEAILAYYYEPYAVAGWLASRWTGRPLIIKHAGSDLDRLFRAPDLATTYKEILRSAEAVVTQLRLMPRFLAMGVDRCRLQPDIPYSVPPQMFHGRAEPLDVTSTAIPADLDGRLGRARKFDPSIPAIGIYGKIGTTKGTFDLIGSLGRLTRDGCAFNFLMMIGSAQGEVLAPALREANLEERTFLLPMLPNWKVPAFIRACTAVCFLERDFPVAIHGPIIPREVLACGACLVLSREIASKQRYRDKFLPGENLLIVEDPKDHTELAATLRGVLNDPGRGMSIGKRGAEISTAIEDHTAYVRGWEDMFSRLINRSGVPATQTSTAPEIFISGENALLSTMPDLVALLQRTYPQLVEEFLRRSTNLDPFRTAIEFCDFADARLKSNAVREHLPKLLAAVAYAKTRVISAHSPTDNNTPPFCVSDRLLGQPVSQQSVWDLRPIRGNWVHIAEFDYDVPALLNQPGYSAQDPIDDHDVDLNAIPSRRTLVLFHRTVNLIFGEFRIDEATRELLSRCDGTSTTADLVNHMRGFFRVETPEQCEEVKGRLLAALDRLYRASVIVFGEHRRGWGWTGGVRTGGKPDGAKVEDAQEWLTFSAPRDSPQRNSLG